MLAQRLAAGGWLRLNGACRVARFYSLCLRRNLRRLAAATPQSDLLPVTVSSSATSTWCSQPLRCGDTRGHWKSSGAEGSSNPARWPGGVLAGRNVSRSFRAGKAQKGGGLCCRCTRMDGNRIIHPTAGQLPAGQARPSYRVLLLSLRGCGVQSTVFTISWRP